MSLRDLPAILGESFSRNSVRGFVVWALAVVSLVAIWSTIAALIREPVGIGNPCKRMTLPCVQTAQHFERAWKYVRDTHGLIDLQPERAGDGFFRARIDSASDNLVLLRGQLQSDNAIFIPLYASVYAALAVWAITLSGRRPRWLGAGVMVALSLLVTLDILENLVGSRLLDALSRCADMHFVTQQDACSVDGEGVLAQFAISGARKWGGFAVLMVIVALTLLVGSRIHRRRLVIASLFSALAAVAALLATLLSGQDAKVTAQGVALLAGAATVVAFSFALAFRWLI